MADDALFCVGQKAFIEKDGKVLIIYDPMEGLDFPGGKIQEGEAKNGDISSLVDSLKREVREEVNIEIEVFNPFIVWYHEFPKGHRNYPKKVYLIGFRCKYLSGELKLSDEHDKFEWVNESDCEKFNDGSDYFNALKQYFNSK